VIHMPIKFAQREDVGSVCVDIRSSPKMDVLVLFIFIPRYISADCGHIKHQSSQTSRCIVYVIRVMCQVELGETCHYNTSLRTMNTCE